MPLRGAGGEPIDFASTVRSHGCASLPPAQAAADFSTYSTRLRAGDDIVSVTLHAQNDVLVARLSSRTSRDQAERALRRMFRLDEDLSAFYGVVAADPELSWAGRGAGRMLASPSVFEDVVKTLCTTNCAWSATVRMMRALVEELGGGAFPTAEQMANAPEDFYRMRARAGYRGAYLRRLAALVAGGELDLEGLRPGKGLNDDEVERALRALPGIGPYACAHSMLLLGRYGRLIFDSWTRPTYLRLSGKKRAADRSIERAFRRYGRYAGLAFWLYLTKDWLPGR